MATGPVTGFSPSRTIGSGPDNQGVSNYSIASGYATNIGKGDPVKLSSGTLALATNGDTTLGVFESVDYIPNDTTLRPTYRNNWPASTAATSISAHVIVNPQATFQATANGTVAQVQVGNLYAVDIQTASVNTYTGRSNLLVQVLAQQLGAAGVLTPAEVMTSSLSISNGDTFTIKPGAPGAATNTVTITTGETVAQLLTAL